jgi:integrase
MYPFKKARLNDCDGDITKRWYIEFYAFDVQQKKLVRKRFYEVNDYTTGTQRRGYARRMIRELNQLLEDGYHLDVNKAPSVVEETKLETTTLADAIKLALEIKKPSIRPSSYPSYKSSVKIFTVWACRNKIAGMDIVYFDRLRAVYFNDYLLIECRYNARTVNGHVAYMKSLFQLLVEREFIGENPFKNIPKHKESTSRRNRAFSKQQIETIKKIVEKKNPQLWLFIQFIYFCFLRPNEIRQLEHRYFNMEERTILVPGSISKNGKDGYVSIPDGFYEQLKQSDYFKSGTKYVFQASKGDKPISKNVMTERFRKLIKQLNLGSDYTLYSWKHSGVVAAYNAGVDIKSIQNQCRHHSLEQTDIYLKSLGLGVSQAINQIPKL